MLAFIGSLWSPSPTKEMPASDVTHNPQTAKTDERYRSWDEANRKKLQRTIFKELVTHCIQPRVLLSGRKKGDEPGTYQIVFRETASWRKVEQLLNIDVNIALIDSQGDLSRADLSRFYYDWGKRITNLRRIKNLYDDTHNSIIELDNPIKGSSSLQKLNSKEANAALKKNLISTLERIQSILRKGLQKGADALRSDRDNVELKRFPSAQKVIDFLQTYWEHLSVFVDWTDVQMDDERLFVKVVKDDMNYQVSTSIKAIFPVKEVRKEEFLPSHNSTLNTPNGVIIIDTLLQRATFGPPTPVLQRRAIALGPPHDDQFLEEKLVEIENVTGRKQLLNEIFEETIEKVNRIFSEGIDSVSF